MEQRVALGDALVKLGAEYPDLVVLSPDVSLSTRATRFRAAYPDRFVCTGISEQNTIGLAAGLATFGWRPVVAGYAMFVGGKAWEPLRNSVAYSGLNVKIVATHAGINVGPDGVTHQAIEDIALMRAVPGMVVLAPTDANQVEPVLRAALDAPGPVYVRLERAAIPLVTPPDMPYTIGESLTLRQGDDVTIVAIGSMVTAALHSADSLAAQGVQARVVSMVSLKPIDAATLVCAAQETGAIVTAEDHNCHGGLGGAVAEVLVQSDPVPVEMVALADTFAESGDVEALRSRYHLTAGDITRAALRAIARRDSLGRRPRPLTGEAAGSDHAHSGPIPLRSPAADRGQRSEVCRPYPRLRSTGGDMPWQRQSTAAPDLAALAERARRMRQHVIRMTCAAGSGHPGPAFSAVDILAALYFAEMRVDPAHPHAPERDRFVLSKGHGAPALYAALREAGYFTDETMLDTAPGGQSPAGSSPRQDARRGCHDRLAGSRPVAGRRHGAWCPHARDWQAVSTRLSATANATRARSGRLHWLPRTSELGNLAVFIDHNQYQFDGPVCDVMALEPLADKWRAFGWHVEEIGGHDFAEILAFLSRARAITDRPSLAVAHTVKGYGVSFMAGSQEYHARSLTDEEAARALAELEAQRIP